MTKPSLPRVLWMEINSNRSAQLAVLVLMILALGALAAPLLA
ncbi:MAG: hypothetical protein RIR26_683, partial [Pseudomonadota bacterium]